MATVTSIRFHREGKNSGCICDHCGQYIRNIWTVRYSNGKSLNFGIDCFSQIRNHDGLSCHLEKKIKKELKFLQKLCDILDAYESGKITEENDQAYSFEVYNCERNKQEPESYEEFRAFYTEKCLPSWINETVLRLKRLGFKIEELGDK